MVLALSYLSAVWVPLDVGFPDDRIAYIMDDSEAYIVVTLGKWTERFDGEDLHVIDIDRRLDEVLSLDAELVAAERPETDPVSYIIYTSGTTGRPKGVPIRHSSICNFVRVASDVYGYEPHDRVYQGMTIAFDFSVEELWVPLAAGATIVPAPADAKLVGQDLDDFLAENQISALCCVPTLLATLDPDRNELRFLLVSGEACPPDVIEPWLVKAERTVNAYGPTEATVTATWSVMQATAPVTIGGPLPSYSVVFLDPDENRVVEVGEEGELCVGGIAVADGYLNRPDKTAKAFIDDFIGITDNPRSQLYRTGDLGRINDNNEIEYLGRIDTQVKIRGYRIELEEIDSVARTVPGVGQVVVNPWDSESGAKQLVAYFTDADPDNPVEVSALGEILRERLPGYMVPTFYERLDELPLLPSTKVNRNALPEPSGVRDLVMGELVAPKNELEEVLCQTLCETFGIDEISTEAHVFNDLGIDSLVVARWLTELHKHESLDTLSAKTIYTNPTIVELAKVSEQTSSGVSAASAPPAVREVPEIWTAQHKASRIRHLATGLAQVAYVSALTLVGVVLMVVGYRWITEADTLVSRYGRLVGASAGMWFGTSGLLIAAKWLAVGRQSVTPLRLWSFAYFRFWVARISIEYNPMNFFRGTPLYNIFLRSIGAQIGYGSVVLTRPPICPDLFSLGQGSMVRADVNIRCFKVERGWVLPGPIDIGSRVVIGDACTLDTYTSMEDGSALGAASGLPRSWVIPEGQTYQGSPPELSEAAVDRVVGAAKIEGSGPAPGRRWASYALFQLITTFGLTSPAAFAAAILVVQLALDSKGLRILPLDGHWARVADSAILTTSVVAGVTTSAVIAAVTLPRFLNIFIAPGRVHPLYGVQWVLTRGMNRVSNIPFLNELLGDSSLILHYLRWLGYDLSQAVQMGSNFGMNQRHHSPFLCTVGRASMVSDGLLMANWEASTHGFTVRPVDVPADVFVGNNVFYPADAAIGNNCLLGTKVAVPTDGDPRTDVGLLGSPAFEIPRVVQRDDTSEPVGVDGLKRDLRAKLRTNLVSMGLYLFRWWIVTFAALLIFYNLARRVNSPAFWVTTMALTIIALLVVFGSPVIAVFLERCTLWFHRPEPMRCSLYDRRFWLHERIWKLAPTLTVFDGTPIKPVLRRIQGARYGKMVYDDNSGVPEPPLTSVGDYSCLNFAAVLQGHSLEDGHFKSDTVEIRASASVGVGAFVHYGTVVEDGGEVEADAFLMKGTTILADEKWSGNPAVKVDRVCNQIG